jgi:hypothetical protein
MEDFDLSYNSISIDCPHCQFQIDILLKQVMAEETIICPGCLQDIKLIDEGSAALNANRDIQNALDELTKSLF